MPLKLLDIFKCFTFQFIRKVYATLFSQLLITLGFILVVVFTPSIRNFYCDQFAEPKLDDPFPEKCVRPSQNGFVMYIVSYIIFFVTYIAIACCTSVRRKSPGNIIALGIFTLALSVMVSSISVYHNAEWVLMAIGITAALCLGLTLFSFQTKIDFTGKTLIMHLTYVIGL